LVFVLLWPAMWIDPYGTFEKMTGQTTIYAIGGHSLNTFFNDYLILYVHQWQRQIPDPAMVDYFSTKIPEFVVKIDGLEYARVCNLHE